MNGSYHKWDDYILDWMRLIIYILATLGAVIAYSSFRQTNLKLYDSLWKSIRYANGSDPKTFRSLFTGLFGTAGFPQLI